MATQPRSINALRLLLDGRETIVEPTNDATILFSLDGHRCAVTSREQDRLIELSTIAPDEDDLLDAAAARVRQQAVEPKTPRGERPSAKQAAVRLAARQYHAATWNAGYAQAQAEYSRQALAERVTEADVPGLVELVIGHVLTNPALREQLLDVLAATEVAALLV